MAHIFMEVPVFSPSPRGKKEKEKKKKPKVILGWLQFVMSQCATGNLGSAACSGLNCVPQNDMSKSSTSTCECEFM